MGDEMPELAVTFYSNCASVHIKGAIFDEVFTVQTAEWLPDFAKQGIEQDLLRKGYAFLREAKQKKIEKEVSNRVLLACFVSSIHPLQLEKTK